MSLIIRLVQFWDFPVRIQHCRQRWEADDTSQPGGFLASIWGLDRWKGTLFCVGKARPASIIQQRSWHNVLMWTRKRYGRCFSSKNTFFRRLSLSRVVCFSSLLPSPSLSLSLLNWCFLIDRMPGCLSKGTGTSYVIYVRGCWESRHIVRTCHLSILFSSFSLLFSSPLFSLDAFLSLSSSSQPFFPSSTLWAAFSVRVFVSVCPAVNKNVRRTLS